MDLLVAEDLLVEAIGWHGADWTHYRRVGGVETTEECVGAAPCETCAEAREDAEEAYEVGLAALDALWQGRYEEAADLAAEAARIEARWGDAPYYGPLARYLERVRDDARLTGHGRPC